jgi:shikimate kinase/3-dehydroquinate synthase
MSDHELPSRIVLIGPSGSGKSELAARLSERLGYRSIDTDKLVERRIEMPISAFFERFGEAAFRALETEAVRQACGIDRSVIATGGGAILEPANWAAFRPGAAVVGLTAQPATLVGRIRAQTARVGQGAERPLLAGDAQARIEAQLAIRGPLYTRADVTIDTDNRGPDEVADLAESAVRQLTREGLIPWLSILTPAERSDSWIFPGIRRNLPALISRRWPGARRVWVITDNHVAGLWMSDLQACFDASGLQSTPLIIPAGEASKTFHTIQDLCNQMTARGVTRRDVVVALGGGVVGDVAGFVAAICLRGLPLAQLPTSLLAMVDSSSGGKTGVNTPAGKNLVGAFYQPGIVAVDPEFLSTLPEPEYRSGMAEVIKHAVIQPSTPFAGRTLWNQLAEIPDLEEVPAGQMTSLLAINIAIKQSVVQADERESDLRMVLNFGHTAGHAIEADGYRYRHGEAVALGMLVESRIALQLGIIDQAFVSNLTDLIRRAGLPVTVQASLDTVLANVAKDKKNVDGSVHWVLPVVSGGVDVRAGVSTAVVRNAFVSLMNGGED